MGLLKGPKALWALLAEGSKGPPTSHSLPEHARLGPFSLPFSFTVGLMGCGPHTVKGGL